MEWIDVYWDTDIESHLLAHNISREEFEEVIRNPIAEDISTSSGRPIRFGLCKACKIAVVYEMVDEITAIPITAYEVK